MKYPLILMTGACYGQMIENAVTMKQNVPLRNAFLMNMLPAQSPLVQLPDFYDNTHSNAHVR